VGFLPISRFRIEDDSMRPALEPGAYVLVNTWAYAFGGPAPGDLVVVRSPEDRARFLVKRVASVMASGDVLVMGDNAERSRDSRHFGLVPRRLVVGRVFARPKP